MKIALPHSPYNRIDLFEAAGFEVVEGSTRSTEEMIDLLGDADGAQVGTLPLTSREVLEAFPAGIPRKWQSSRWRCSSGSHVGWLMPRTRPVQVNGAKIEDSRANTSARFEESPAIP